MKRLPLIASFILFIALCVSVAYWSMQLFMPKARPVMEPAREIQAAPSLDAASSLFGNRVEAAAASNYQLNGVFVAINPVESVAILSANGKPPQAIITHAEVAPGVVLKEVNRRYVLLSEGGVIKRIELPEGVHPQMKMGFSGKIPGPGKMQ